MADGSARRGVQGTRRAVSPESLLERISDGLATAPPCPRSVRALVSQFSAQAEAYKSPAYKEAQLRQEFLDPLFAALGWDMRNAAGLSETYKEVIHEDSLRVGPAMKAPDYAFRVGGRRVFLVEAKKPSVDLHRSRPAAYQLRRYAWNAGLPISILCDFEEFVVYDCRDAPRESDTPSHGRILYWTHDQYVSEWPTLWCLFGRPAMDDGWLDEIIAASERRRAAEPVGEAFLMDVEQWREDCARGLARSNPSLTARELNYAVQQTIDRLVFLRFCEDRGVEDWGRLRDLCKAPGIYDRLVTAFRRADERYNSGLFHFTHEPGRDAPDTLTPSLQMDDSSLRDIIEGLYGEYLFGVMPPEILGRVYEQLLGSVIHITASRDIVIDQKPAVRKAGGVFYTPQHVVDYIVRETVGKLLEGKTPRGAANVRVLDPACGSGSFLLGAYQYLLDWHRDWYIADDVRRHSSGKNPKIRSVGQNSWRLTTSERKRILLNNIYGVDIDERAVEVAKLSLLLKVLEGETVETIARQFLLFHERALPDLDANIRCGNSLIAADYYEFHSDREFDAAEIQALNAFEWENEHEAIMDSGGFDAVIGNPPYILLQDEFRDDAQLAYFRSKYRAASYKVDTYHLFIERAIELARQGGRVSFITPSNFLTNNYLDGLRRLLLDKSRLSELMVIDGGVFKGVSVDNAIFVTEAGRRSQKPIPLRRSIQRSRNLREVNEILLYPDGVREDTHLLMTGTGQLAGLWKRLDRAGVALGAFAKVNFGKQLRDRSTHDRDVISVDALADVPPGYAACYTGKDVTRYHVEWGGLACLDDPSVKRGGCWNPDIQSACPKLLTRQIGLHPEFAMDEAGYQCLNTMFMVSVSGSQELSLFILGLLNSTLLRAYWVARYWDQRRTFPKIKGTYLKAMPVLPLDHSAVPSVSRLAGQLVEAQRQRHAGRVPSEVRACERRIAALEQQMDVAVADAYGVARDELELAKKALQDAETAMSAR